jgi:hypothetical protein
MASSKWFYSGLYIVHSGQTVGNKSCIKLIAVLTNIVWTDCCTTKFVKFPNRTCWEVRDILVTHIWMCWYDLHTEQHSRRLRVASGATAPGPMLQAKGRPYEFVKLYSPVNWKCWYMLCLKSFLQVKFHSVVLGCLLYRNRLHVTPKGKKLQRLKKLKSCAKSRKLI